MSGSRSPRRYLLGDTPSNRVDVRIARDLNDLLQVFAVRALVYMGEQACPFDEEFDGNDLTGATHLIAFVARQPVGVLRLRWFADFVKVERVAVTKEHRGGEVVRVLFGAGIELARKRGYRRALGYIQAHLAPFWARLGFRERRERARFSFSDRLYIEVEGEIEPHPDALSMNADPMVLIRPDGQWDRPGVLDHSVTRPALNLA